MLLQGKIFHCHQQRQVRCISSEKIISCIIIQKDGKVVPIEVKSGNTRANSLKSIMKNNKDISYGYKFIDGNVGTSEEGIITLPLYMIAFFDKVSE